MWTKQCVEDSLRKNPYFEHLLDEGEGHFACMYVVEGIHVIIFYGVGGFIDVKLLSVPQTADVAANVQEFAAIAKEICKDIVAQKGGEL